MSVSDRRGSNDANRDASEGRVSQRISILIDGASLFQAASTLHFEVDYAKLLPCLAQGRSVVQSYFYTGVSSGNVKQQAFLNWMRNHGYRVVAKELIRLPDGTRRADLTVEMAIDMLMFAEYCDTIVLVSGNGNLTYAVNATANKGVQIELVSLATQTHTSLFNVIDRFIDLAMIRSQIQKTGQN